jgi:hypothetical protein
MWRLLALTLALIPAARAETYKWVDERGVVNYSNTPPPATAKATQGIADRISIIESDPALRKAAYSPPSPYELMQQQEWLQRQRLMAERQYLQAAYPPVDPYVDPYYRGTRFLWLSSRPAVHPRRRPALARQGTARRP